MFISANKHCRSEVVAGDSEISASTESLAVNKEKKDCYGEFTRLFIVVSITIEQVESEFWLARPFQSLSVFTGCGLFIS